MSFNGRKRLACDGIATLRLVFAHATLYVSGEPCAATCESDMYFLASRLEGMGTTIRARASVAANRRNESACDGIATFRRSLIGAGG
jgi:hypothetical protein